MTLSKVYNLWFVPLASCHDTNLTWHAKPVLRHRLSIQYIRCYVISWSSSVTKCLGKYFSSLSNLRWFYLHICAHITDLYMGWMLRWIVIGVWKTSGDTSWCKWVGCEWFPICQVATNTKTVINKSTLLCNE